MRTIRPRPRRSLSSQTQSSQILSFQILSSRTLFAALATLATLALDARGARAEEPVTEVDRRATLALWNSTTAEATPHDLKEIGPDNVRRLALYKPLGEHGGREYAIRFGVREADGSGRGFHKIVVGGKPTDPTQKDWVLVMTLKDPAFELWQKRVEKSDAERYVEWACRGIVGQVILNVVETRRLSEAAAAAHAPMVARYKRLFEAARAAGLFAKAKATLYMGEGDETGYVLGEGEAPWISVTPGGSRHPLRLEMEDAAGNPVEAKWYRIAFTGPLAPFATVEGAETRGTTAVWLVRDPGLVVKVHVLLPPDSPAIRDALMVHAESGAEGPALSLAVGARRR